MLSATRRTRSNHPAERGRIDEQCALEDGYCHNHDLDLALPSGDLTVEHVHDSAG
jgi:hypothetical protein